MTSFLKKIKSLVGASKVSEPQTAGSQRNAQTKSGNRKKAAAPREKAPVLRASEPVAAPPSQEESAPAPVARAATPVNVGKRQPLDPEHINLADAWEVQYRRKQFGCTELQLRQAVAAVGDSVTRVVQHFRAKSTPPKGGKQRYE